MRTIAIFDEKNYKENANRFIREAVRAVIIKDGKVALVKSLKEKHYKFPGGGIEENETHIDTLIRETKEETGLVIKSSTIKKCGLIHEIRKSIYNDDVFEQKSYYYFAEVEDNVLKQELSENEKELQYVLEWVNPSIAYEVNTNLGKEYANKFLLREACVLNLLIGSSVRLAKPSEEHFNQLLELKQDFIKNNEPRIQGSGSIDKYDDLNEWLKSINDIEQGKNEKIVPSTYYLILSDDEVVGTICMRHYLTKDLEEFGGHIGYSIKPSARRKGYAKEALRLILELYKDKYDEILIMCEDDNIASNKTILANGGILINQIEKFGLKINRYKIVK
ncbi:MAG: GNAT family N-acetyltransferase [Bacilli bacterium]|nr:GNAT family N-acetyltransferase [Bacilli bacterium]